MQTVTIRKFPEIGRYRLFSNQQKACTFFDARDRFEAKTYAIGAIGMNTADKCGTLTDLATGESWAIVVEVTALTADERADFNNAIRAEVTA